MSRYSSVLEETLKTGHRCCSQHLHFPQLCRTRIMTHTHILQILSQQTMLEIAYFILVLDLDFQLFNIVICKLNIRIVNEAGVTIYLLNQTQDFMQVSACAWNIDGSFIKSCRWVRQALMFWLTVRLECTSLKQFNFRSKLYFVGYPKRIYLYLIRLAVQIIHRKSRNKQT